MSSFLTAEDEPFVSFERGIDRDAARTSVKPGGYDAAVNMLLASATSGRHMSTCFLDTELDSAAAWPTDSSDGLPADAIWFAPFTYSTYDEDTQALSDATHLLVDFDNGQTVRYDAGSPGTVTNVRRTTAVSGLQVNGFPYNQWLVKVDGRNAPMKYGQHFLWNGQLHPTPYMFPLGSRPISPLDSDDTAGESWTHQAGSNNGFKADAIVPQGARLGSHSLRVNKNKNSIVNFVDADGVSVAVDLAAPPQPYGGSDFAATDYLVFSAIGASTTPTTGNIRIRFHDKTAPTTKYFTFTQAPAVDNTEWLNFALLRSAAVNTGTAVWTNIGRVTFFNDDKSKDVFIDDFYFLYANAPPAAQVGCTHKNRVALGGAPVGATAGEPFLDTLVYSDSGAPDEFPTANSDPFSGSVAAHTRTNVITALREYNDNVVVGLPNSIKAWTIGDAGNPVKSTISSEFGIDSHRSLVETPSGSLMFAWQRGLYLLRATGRQFISPKIGPFLATMHVEDPSWTIAVADETTKTIRVCWRTGTDSTSRTTTGVVFDTVRSQGGGEPIYPSTMTQVFDYAAPAYVNGVRETLYVKAGSPHVWRMHVTASGTLTSSVTLPWMSRGETKDRLTKWMGVTAAYSATGSVGVYVRYAQHPQQFDTAEFELRETLDSGPDASDIARALFGGTSKWVQVKFEATAVGFELFPPVGMIEVPTSRPG